MYWGSASQQKRNIRNRTGTQGATLSTCHWWDAPHITGSSPVCTSSLRGWLSGYLSGRTAASWLISTILPDACPAALPVNMAWLMRGYAIPANRPPGCYTLAAEKGSGLRHLAFWPNCILSRTFRIIRTILGDIHFL